VATETSSSKALTKTVNCAKSTIRKKIKNMSCNPYIHHHRSICLKRYDYSQAGLYFVTLCVQNRHCLFGKIMDNEMILNEYGKIAYNEWFNTPNIRAHIQSDVFIVIPNQKRPLVTKPTEDVADRKSLYEKILSFFFVLYFIKNQCCVPFCNLVINKLPLA
jgi:hypothetical protein